MVYDKTSDLLGVYFRVTGKLSINSYLFQGGRGAHWGGNMYQLDRKGNVVYQTFGCSHDMGGKLIPDSSGAFPFLCMDDGFGINRPLNKIYGARAQIKQECDFAQAGYSPAILGSLVKRS